MTSDTHQIKFPNDSSLEKNSISSPVSPVCILSLDVGDKFIGVSWVQEHGIAIEPLPPLIRKKGSLALGPLKKIISTYKITDIVIGHPLVARRRCAQSEKVRAYRGKLRKHFPQMRIFLQDETLSTWSAERKFAKLKLTKSNKRENIDSFAAMEILTDFLNR